MKPIYKLNNGNGAMLCNKCRVIIHTGKPSKRVLCDKCLADMVYKWPTKHKQGFNRRDENRILATIGKENLNTERYIDALHGITSMVIDGDLIIYHDDILTALRVAMEDRRIRTHEWD